MDDGIIVSHSASVRQREYAAILRGLIICLPLLRLNDLCMIRLCASDIDAADEFVAALVAACDLRGQLFPLAAQLALLLLILWRHCLILFFADFLQRRILI